MSRQSKNAKKRQLARQITELHKRGEKAGAKSKPVHGKDPSKRLYTAFKRGNKDKR